jgi:hypothetical protein
VVIQRVGVGTRAGAVLLYRRQIGNNGLIVINSAAKWCQSSAGMGKVSCPLHNFALIAQRVARSVRGQPIGALGAKLGGFSRMENARLVIRIAWLARKSLGRV